MESNDEELRQGMKWRTKEHYNSKTGFDISHRESEELRRNSEAFPLRKFHNAIKYALLQQFAYGKNRLIDLGCGRGGDIWKWIDARVQNVTGLDLSDGEIEEAKKRFQDVGRKRHGPLPKMEFYQTDKLDMELIPIKQDMLADVVTCMFVIHYFFISERGCKQLFQNIAHFLKPDGYFICCFPDAKRVLALLDGRDRVDLPSLAIGKCWKAQPQCFGSGYTFSLRDTVTEIVHEKTVENKNAGEKDNNSNSSNSGLARNSRESYQKEPQQLSKAPPPEEYLVFFNVFEALGKEVGLYPVIEYPPSLAALFEAEDRERPFKHFKPNREGEERDKASFRGCDPSLCLASGINVAVVMQKRASPPERRGETRRETSKTAEVRDWDRMRERERELERERDGEMVQTTSRADDRLASVANGSGGSGPPRRANVNANANPNADPSQSLHGYQTTKNSNTL